MYENDSDSEEDVDESDKNPNPKLSQGSNIPRRYGTFPIHLANTPIVDIDPFFKDKRTFIVVSNSNRLVCPKSYTIRIILSGGLRSFQLDFISKTNVL